MNVDRVQVIGSQRDSFPVIAGRNNQLFGLFNVFSSNGFDADTNIDFNSDDNFETSISLKSARWNQLAPINAFNG